jgi:hypothetical protein
LGVLQIALFLIGGQRSSFIPWPKVIHFLFNILGDKHTSLLDVLCYICTIM